jgi:hypothetical protein
MPDQQPDYHPIVAQAASDAGLDPALVDRLVQAESAYNPLAVSKKGALGLMQLMPATAVEFGAKDPFDPEQNVRAGVKKLKGLLDRYSGDERLALAAYNAGEGAVDQHGGVPPYPETQAYVNKIAGPIDYDALARKVEAPSGGSVDYDALARNAGEVQPKGQVIYSNAPKVGPSLSDVVDVAIGAFKQPGRLVQMIPGVAAATDKLYGLPSGASAQSMEPTNTAQRVGGIGADVAEMLGTGMAEAGVAYTRNALGQFVKAPYVQTVAGRAARAAAGPVADVMGGAANALKNELGFGGSVTAAKVGSLVGRYGAKAIKAAMYGAGLGAGYDAWEELTK